MVMPQIHLVGIVESAIVTTDTEVLLVLVGTPRYLVVSDLERITYPPLTDLISQRMEFPKEEINPDVAVAEEDEFRK
jgi:hypothetical protein